MAQKSNLPGKQKTSFFRCNLDLDNHRNLAYVLAPIRLSFLRIEVRVRAARLMESPPRRRWVQQAPFIVVSNRVSVSKTNRFYSNCRSDPGLGKFHEFFKFNYDVILQDMARYDVIWELKLFFSHERSQSKCTIGTDLVCCHHLVLVGA